MKEKLNFKRRSILFLHEVNQQDEEKPQGLSPESPEN